LDHLHLLSGALVSLGCEFLCHRGRNGSGNEGGGEQQVFHGVLT
jgi:hypothetical protein